MAKNYKGVILIDINLLKRREGELEEEYLWRIGQYIEQGKYRNWEEIVNIVNEQLREDESEYRTESAYRKREWLKLRNFMRTFFLK